MLILLIKMSLYVLFIHLLLSIWNSYFIRLACTVFVIRRVPDSIGCSLSFFWEAGRGGENDLYETHPILWVNLCEEHETHGSAS